VDPRSNAELFIVRDANGQALSYVCYESEPGRRAGTDFIIARDGKIVE
jgi:hypothetical protein